MTKAVFLKTLSDKLHRLPAQERQQHLDYYDELLSDMMEDGIPEQEAVEKLGDISRIVDEILKDIPIQTLVKNRIRPKNGWTGAAIAFAVIGAPIWLPILFAILITAAETVMLY